MPDLTAYQRIIRAFEIFDSYPDRQSTHAEHDEFFAGPDPTTVSAEHLAELEQLGWRPCKYDCFRLFT